jgi:autotransporter-associated beta strand protein
MGGAPSPGEPAVALIFPGGASNSNNNNDIANLTIDQIVFGGGGYTVTGNAITLRKSIMTQAAVGIPGVAFGLSMQLAGTIQAEVDGAGTLTLGGTLSGSGGIFKRGPGKLDLQQANSYTGGTTEVEGILQVDTDLSLGSGPLFLRNGTFQSGASVALANPFTVGDVPFDPLATVTIGGDVRFNDLTFTGNGIIEPGYTLSINNVGTTTFGDPKTTAGGVISGGGGILMQADRFPFGRGRAVFNRFNTYEGGTRLNSGVLVAGTDTAFGTGPLTLTNIRPVPPVVPNPLPPFVPVLSTIEAQRSLSEAGRIVSLVNLFTVTNVVEFGGTDDLTFNERGTLNAPHRLLVTNTKPTTFAKVINGTAGLNKDGPGTLVLGAPNAYTGQTSILDGTLSVGINQALPKDTTVAVALPGTLLLNGFINTIHTLISFPFDTGLGAGTANLGAGTLTIADNGVTNAIFDGTLLGTGNSNQANQSLVKSGNGKWTLTLATGVSSLSGRTQAAGGILEVDGNLSLSPVDVEGPATLSGSGVVGPLTVLGTVRPGTDVATSRLTANGDTTFLSGGTLRIRLNGNVAGTSYDQLAVNGKADLTKNPGLIITIGFVINNGDAFTILTSPADKGPVVGNFGGLLNKGILPLGDRPAQNFRGDYTKNDVILTRVVADTTTDLTSSPNPSAFGQPVVFTATVAGKPPTTVPTGTVTFKEGDTVLSVVALDSHGKAVYSTPGFDVGQHTITASYESDLNFVASMSGAVTQTVTSATSTTTLAATPTTSVQGQPVTLTATVTGTRLSAGIPAGSVTFRDGTTVLGTANLDQDGRAILSTGTLAGGKRTLTAVYNPPPNNPSFLSSTSEPVTVTVNQATASVSVHSSLLPAPPGAAVTFTATVSPVAPATLTPTGTVVFRVDGVAQPAVPLSNGRGAFSTSFQTEGNHVITATYSGDNSYAGSTSGPLNQKVNANASLNGCDSQSFVTQVYLDLLHRPVDASGMASWGGILDSGKLTRADVVVGIERSPEYLGLQVRTAFQKLLRREPEPASLTNLILYLAQGRTVAQLNQLILASPEYYNRFGHGNVDNYLQAMYQDVLGRPVDREGLAFWGGQLDQGAVHDTVASGIVNSQEMATITVRNMYSQYLGRTADPVGLNAFVGQLMRGQSEEQVLASIVGSDEYCKRATAVTS